MPNVNQAVRLILERTKFDKISTSMFEKSKKPHKTYLWIADSNVSAKRRELSKVKIVEKTADITFIAWKFLKPISSESALSFD